MGGLFLTLGFAAVIALPAVWFYEQIKRDPEWSPPLWVLALIFGFIIFMGYGVHAEGWEVASTTAVFGLLTILVRVLSELASRLDA